MYSLPSNSKMYGKEPLSMQQNLAIANLLCQSHNLLLLKINTFYTVQLIFIKKLLTPGLKLEILGTDDLHVTINRTGFNMLSCFLGIIYCVLNGNGVFYA